MGEKKITKQIGARIDKELIKELRHLCIDKDRNFNDILSEAIRDLLKKYSKKK